MTADGCHCNNNMTTLPYANYPITDSTSYLTRDTIILKFINSVYKSQHSSHFIKLREHLVFTVTEEEENLFAKKAGCQKELQPIDAGYHTHN